MMAFLGSSAAIELPCGAQAAANSSLSASPTRDFVSLPPPLLLLLARINSPTRSTGSFIPAAWSSAPQGWNKAEGRRANNVICICASVAPDPYPFPSANTRSRSRATAPPKPQRLPRKQFPLLPLLFLIRLALGLALLTLVPILRRAAPPCALLAHTRSPRSRTESWRSERSTFAGVGLVER